MAIITESLYPAPAKINRFLHIIGQREDGYHHLQTIFQFLDFSDYLDITVNDSGCIIFDCDDANLLGESNLVVKAAKLLQKLCPEKGANIYLYKILPTGAGIGGGSSDAATTLTVLNQLWQLNLSQQKLLSLASSLGADVAIFIYAKSAWAEGIGDQFYPMPDLDRGYCLLIKAKVSINTAELFSDPELNKKTKPLEVGSFVSTENVFSSIIRKKYAEINFIFEYFADYQPQLTGTGACVFCLFKEEQWEVAEKALAKLPKNYHGWLVLLNNQSQLLL